MTETHAPASTAAFYLRRIVHLAAVIDGTPADHALCGMNLQYGAIDTTADATCADCLRVQRRLVTDAYPENLPTAPHRYDPSIETADAAPMPAPRHWTREEVLDRLRETGGFDLILGPDDTAYDLEVGDTMLGGVTLRYAYGEFPGTAYRTIVLDDEPAVDDDPREEPAPLEWSEVAGSPSLVRPEPLPRSIRY